MSSGPFFLSIQQVLAIHRRVVEEFGGDPGIRDAGLLESAVAMPAAQVAGEFLHEDLFAMAAAYLFHLCKNHPFLDGNKRTALSSALVFLVLNETELDASDAARVRFEGRFEVGSNEPAPASPGLVSFAFFLFFFASARRSARRAA